MKAYVTRDETGAVKEGWLLRSGTSVTAIMCRSQRTPLGRSIQQVEAEEAMHGAAHCPHADCEACSATEHTASRQIQRLA